LRGLLCYDSSNETAERLRVLTSLFQRMPASKRRRKGVCHNSSQANGFETAQKEALTELNNSLQVIRSGLGPLPFVKDKDEKDAAEADEPEEAPARAQAPASNRPAVLPDGSYATQVSRIHVSAIVQHICKT